MVQSVEDLALEEEAENRIALSERPRPATQWQSLDTLFRTTTPSKDSWRDGWDSQSYISSSTSSENSYKNVILDPSMDKDQLFMLIGLVIALLSLMMVLVACFCCCCFCDTENVS